MVTTPSKTTGFHLLELLITLVILAVILCLATPHILSWLNRYRLNTIASDIEIGIEYSRFLAYTNENTYALSPLVSNCGWSCGMKLVKIVGGRSTILYTWRWNDDLVHVTWVGAGDSQRLVFSPYPAHAMSAGHFNLQVGTYKKKLVLNRLGRILKKRC